MADTYYKELQVGGQMFKFAVNLTGNGAPTTATAAEVGMFYMDTASTDGTVYKCIGKTDADGAVQYVWKQLGDITGGGTSFEAGNALELADGVLNVKTTDTAEEDNTLPITSAGVHTIVGNIGAILDTI